MVNSELPCCFTFHVLLEISLQCLGSHTVEQASRFGGSLRLLCSVLLQAVVLVAASQDAASLF